MGRLTPLDDFDYILPKSFIAQYPAEKRDTCRLMVLRGGEIKDAIFRDISDYFSPPDCLVLNATKVIPAKIRCKKTTGGKVELLMLRKLKTAGACQTWAVLSRDKIDGKQILFENGACAGITGRTEPGEFIVEFDKDVDVDGFLDEFGEMPLPPYINRKAAAPAVKTRDREDYQTVYARESGSAAAPTAGLHFTDALLKQISAKGIEIAEIITHIGWDTFRPVKAKYAEEHKMHGECYEISADAAKKINNCRRAGGRIIAVGTSAVRAIESAAGKDGVVRAISSQTDLFIYPGYEFKATDLMLTNFHLPKSTPYLMVCALAGVENIRKSYEEAKSLGYRFYSYGDAMLICRRHL